MNDVQERLQEIAEELQGLSGDVVDEASGLLEDAAEVLREAQSHRTLTEATDLARAVLDFAEWQSEDYITDLDTRQIIGHTLWLEVSAIATFYLLIALQTWVLLPAVLKRR